MIKKVIYHKHSDKVITRHDRITKCPMGKNRKMKPTDSPYNEVCDGCVDNACGHMNSVEEIIYCDYRKRLRKENGVSVETMFDMMKQK